ncbi:MAG: response regulator [bacterium]|nr:response regulator [bacterium]
MALVFSAVVLAMMLTVAISGAIIYSHVSDRNERELQETIAGLLADSINRVSFSGKYHARLLVEQIAASQPRIASIVILDTAGDVIASSEPESGISDPVELDAASLNAVLTEKRSVFKEIVRGGTSFRQVAIPYRSGYQDGVTGVILLEMSTEEARRAEAHNRMLLTILVLSLSLVSLAATLVLSRKIARPVINLATRFRTILDRAPMLIRISDRDGHLLECSSSLSAMPAEDATLLNSEIAEVFASNREVEREVSLERDDNPTTFLATSFPVLNDKHGVPTLACSIGLDITERKAAEKEQRILETKLRQSQKMEAVGQLAGGVAHDFNNLLQAILGYGEIAQLKCEEGSSVYESLDQVMIAGQRAKTLVSQLLAFSRRQVLQMEDLDLTEVMADLMKMLRRVIGEHIVLDIKPGDALGWIRADRGQIEQILINLCINARDAMPAGGEIVIETENVQIDEEYCSTHDWSRAGRYVRLSVTDTGCGMNKRTLARVFEPFFTTKSLGKGTGLGLATVYGLVKQHDSQIEVYSEVDKGTTFKIYFPLVESAALPISNIDEGAVAGGTETILLAEDDEMVREVCVSILEDAGYSILLATDGEEALQVYEEHGDKIDLALLDVVMPKLGGRAVFERIRETRPELSVLFASGYSMNAIHTNFVLEEGLMLIQKPYKRADLLRKVREMLDKR